MGSNHLFQIVSLSFEHTESGFLIEKMNLKFNIIRNLIINNEIFTI